MVANLDRLFGLLKQLGVVDRNRGLQCDALQQAFVAAGEYPRPQCPKKSPPTISPDREMTGTAR